MVVSDRQRLGLITSALLCQDQHIHIVIFKRDLGRSIIQTSSLVTFINMVSLNCTWSAFSLYFPFLRVWNQLATTKSWILKSRRLLESVSAKRKKNGEWPQRAFSSFMPCFTPLVLLLWHWQLGSQQHCSLPPDLQGVSDFSYTISLCGEEKCLLGSFQ